MFLAGIHIDMKRSNHSRHFIWLKQSSPQFAELQEKSPV